MPPRKMSDMTVDVSGRIEHVVVLMLENRSFDHLFGYFPGVEGISSGDFYNLADPNNPESDANLPYPVGTDAPFAIEKGQGPGHSLDGSTTQLFGTKHPPSMDLAENRLVAIPMGWSSTKLLPR